MKTIRETLKEKFNGWLDERCDKGLSTYGHELDDCPDDKFDWRNMLIEELLDGLQYQEKEIHRLQKENKELKKRNQILKDLVPSWDERKLLNEFFNKPPYADLDD